MSDPNILPAPLPEESQEGFYAEETEHAINPFADSPPVEQQPSRLDLGGGILGQMGVLIPEATAEKGPEGEVTRDAEAAAKKACGLIAEMYIEETDPNSIVFPQCSDMAVIDLALRQLGNTPLGLGYGAFPETVPKAWARFLTETTTNYRRDNNLETADLVPVHIRQLPEWLKQNPEFDILQGCELMDIVIESPVESVIASNVKHCRLHFKGRVLNDAEIGIRAERSTFIFDQHLHARRSFQHATNVSVEIRGDQRGQLGPMQASTVSCAGAFSGSFMVRRNTGCKAGEGVSSTRIQEIS
jgi:hypothetical protein